MGNNFKIDLKKYIINQLIYLIQIKKNKSKKYIYINNKI